VASVANPAVTGTAAPEATAVFPGAIGPKVNHRLELISGVRRVPVLRHTTRSLHRHVWLGLVAGDLPGRHHPCLPASSQPEGAEPIAVTCRVPHGPPSDGVELAPFLITAYSALRLELLPSPAPGEL
jgi:hypothetical protein